MNKSIFSEIDQISMKMDSFTTKAFLNGGLTEIDQEINDLSQQLFKAFKKEYSESAYLFRWYNNNDTYKNRLLVPICQVEKLYNFDFDFIIPCYNIDIENYLIEFRKTKDTKLMENIINKVYEIGGKMLEYV